MKLRGRNAPVLGCESLKKTGWALLWQGKWYEEKFVHGVIRIFISFD